jgi:hypothetical protein
MANAMLFVLLLALATRLLIFGCAEPPEWKVAADRWR